MSRILLRLWAIAAAAWIAYSANENHDKLTNLSGRDWRAALEYGINNILCDLKSPVLCRTSSVSPWRQTELNETFVLLVIFVGVPVGMLLVLLTITSAAGALKVLVGLPIVILLLLAIFWATMTPLTGR